MLHARIAARAFNTPLLVEPSKAMAFLSGLGPRILGRQIELAKGTEAHDASKPALPTRAGILTNDVWESFGQQGETPFPVVDGIAVIEIAGVLIHRGGWIGQSSGQTSYEGIAAQIEAAVGNPSVRGVALEIDSFGGEVAGVFDLADRIRALRWDKPVWAFVAEHAFSAGYALASQADRILLPRTGALGSIGVVVMHADLSGKLDQDGVQVTLIHSGQHKVDGNPYEPLPEPVHADIQREIDVLRFLFAETVAAGRSGRLVHEAALATEAAIYRGADAVAAGLADEVTDLARGFAAFDISMANHDPEAFEAAAREAGFFGFGFYPRSNFMHVDLGPAREWGTRFPKRVSGFAGERRPAREHLAESRTMKGGGAAGVATIGAAGVEVAQDVLAETQTAVLPLVPYLDTLRWVFIAVALGGIAVAIYARLDDWKRGQR